MSRLRFDFRKKFQWVWWGTGTDCTEKLWVPYRGRCSRSSWMGHWAAWSGVGCPSVWREVRKRGSLSSFPSQAILALTQVGLAPRRWRGHYAGAWLSPLLPSLWLSCSFQALGIYTTLTKPQAVKNQDEMPSAHEDSHSPATEVLKADQGSSS